MNTRAPCLFRPFAALLVAVIVIGFCVPPAAAAGLTTAESSAKTERLLADSGHTFVKKTDTVWFIEYHGKSLANYKVIVAVEDDLMVVFVTVVRKAQMQLTPEFAEKLLRASSRFDRVKIGLDNDGDLFVRCDASVRVTDLTEFKALLDQVANVSDELYKDIRGSLISP